MKKSAQVPLTLVTVVAASLLQSCRRERAGDPCTPQTYNDQVCQEAVANRGYYSHGTWIPMMYPYPHRYYNRGYQDHIARGGRVRSSSSSVYARPTARGGFGSTGSSRGFSFGS